MEIPILKDLIIIFALAVIVLWICNRLRLPSIVGFLLTGIASGPHGLGFIKGIDDVETLSKIGIMLLLFTIGLEFSLKRLMQIKHYVFFGGILQVGLTILIAFGIAECFRRPFGEALFLGFLLSMSSTAIVSKALESKDEADSPQGHVNMGILIFQDLIAVPMIVIIPVLGNIHHALHISFFLRLLAGFAIIFAVFVAAIKIVPPLLYQIARVRSRELFLLSVLTICCSVAWLASSMGLSLAIGAFLAGLILSDTEYNHEIVSNILPLQDIFSSLFFVSIGMLLDLHFVLEQPLLILMIALGIMLMKGIVVMFTTLCLRLPLRIMILTGIALCQIGEFSFVLARTGMESGLGSVYLNQLFLAVAIFTMSITPLLIDYSHSIATFILKLPLPDKWKTGLKNEVHKVKHSDHVVIIGFGVAGKNLARASKDANLEYVIVELNPKTVRDEKLKGEPIHYGDASHAAVLHHLHIDKAKAIAVMINDAQAAKRIAALVRKINPNAYLIVRTRYAKEVSQLYKLGADEVIPDEIGTSIEMFVHVLKRFEIAPDKIDTFANNLRTESYQALRQET